MNSEMPVIGLYDLLTDDTLNGVVCMALSKPCLCEHDDKSLDFFKLRDLQPCWAITYSVSHFPVTSV